MALPVRVANLDEGARNVQLRAGILVTAMGLGLAVTLHAYGASRATAWALLPPFFVGAYGMLSALTGTCSFTALAGRRRAEARTEPVADRAELAAIRRRGGGLVALSFAVAAVAAALMALAE